MILSQIMLTNDRSPYHTYLPHHAHDATLHSYYCTISLHVYIIYDVHNHCM